MVAAVERLVEGLREREASGQAIGFFDVLGQLAVGDSLGRVADGDGRVFQIEEARAEAVVVAGDRGGAGQLGVEPFDRVHGPGGERWMRNRAAFEIAAMEQVLGSDVVALVRGHRANDRDLIHLLGKTRQVLGEMDAGDVRRQR